MTDLPERPNRSMRSDVFGVGLGERALRLMAGASAAVILAGAVVGVVLPPVVLVVAAVVYGIGIPMSFVLEARWPSRTPVPLLRYAALGTVLGGIGGALLFAGDDFPGLWMVSGGIGAAAGAAGGAVVPVVGVKTPARAVPWVAAIGPVVTALVIVVLVVMSRPPAPYGSYLIIDADPAISDPITSSADVAQRIADTFRSQRDPLSHDAWVAVGETVTATIRQPYAISYAQIEPLELDDGRRARLVTVEADGSRSCVVVLETDVQVRPGTCDADDI